MKHIALIADTGGGKGTFVDYIAEKYGHIPLTMSDFVERKAKLHNLIEPSDTLSDRARKAELGNILAKSLGTNYLAKAVVDIVEENPNKTYVIDGVRRLGELTEIKYRLKDNVISIAIAVSDAVRMARLKNRDNMSEDYFNKLKESAKSYDLNQLIEGADYVVNNNGTIAEFQNRIDKVMVEIL